ncbi:MAG TPA: SDR family oxidoreductase [Limnobacter sp.]|uniref:SDR family NAD(P)-dependent oxidoreductase n=1 Tax=Limnobacter sp. TaxID=2003368 RepID=UPI002ED9EC62
MGYFSGKVVVVTGAGSGMGRSYALEFARSGARLALMDFDVKGLGKTVTLLNGLGRSDILHEVFDVSNREAMFGFAERVLKRFGTVDVVINNAGIAGDGMPAWETSLKAYERVMAVNFYGVLHGTQAFLPTLIRKNQGHVVNVSSIFGLVGAPSHTDYSASKFAVRGYTEALMAELSATGVGVHLVHPGGIATNIAKGGQFDKFDARYLTTSPDDIARVVRKGIERGRARMVYGNDSFKTWLGARLVPVKWLSKLVWHDMKATLNLAPYAQAGVVNKTIEQHKETQ